MKTSPIVINGWTIFTHPLFTEQLNQLIQQVEDLKTKDPANYHNKNAAKRLAAINKLAFELIPQAPDRLEYRQGSTLGDSYKHWFRAKFFQQYRLFFRYHQASKIIIYAWVNDDNTKRAYESHQDAYRVFRNMLIKGNPPNSWNELLQESAILNDQ